jgi:hypothetical protein
MARGTYVLSSGGMTTVNAVVTLAFINPGTTQSIAILRCWASQAASATSAQQRIQLVSQVTAFPTLTSKTPAKTSIIDPVSVIIGGTAGAAGTAGVNATAEGGTKTVLVDDAFNVLNGWLWVPTPNEIIVMNASAASGFGVYLPVTPPAATQTSWSVGIVYQEL